MFVGGILNTVNCGCGEVTFDDDVGASSLGGSMDPVW